MPEAAVLPEVYPTDTGASPHTGHPAPSPQPLAGFGARANSSLIDYVAPVIVLNLLLSLVVATGGVVAWRPVLAGVGYLVLLLGFGVWNSGYLQGTTGQSLGRRVTRTKLVTIETGRPVGFGRAVARQICHGLEFRHRVPVAAVGRQAPDLRGQDRQDSGDPG
ncbi:MAG: RDD family protein [Actinomycetota bacterium]|nr:RDD family protein [Actinomycetota bacterium]